MRLNSRFSLLVIFLLVIGTSLIVYRYSVAGIPFTPGQTHTVWSVEAKVSFTADDAPVNLSLALPAAQPSLTRIAERTASPGFGLRFDEDNSKRRAEWSIRQASGLQTLYYVADFQVANNSAYAAPLFSVTPPPRFLGPLKNSAKALLERIHQTSANDLSLAYALIAEFQTPQQDVQFLLQGAPASQRIVELLSQADIPARTVKVLLLEDGARRQSLQTWVQLIADEQVHLLDPKGEHKATQPLLIWEQGDKSVIDLIGGHGAKIGFSMLKQRMPISGASANSAVLNGTVLNGPPSAHGNDGLLNLSIHSLPLNDQSVFKGILLVPVGVLLVVIMRTLVGLSTSGTFMPVLIALAFMQTSLLTGVVGFLLIVGVGLLIRSYFSRHNLLLVARISLVIISVVLILALFSVISYRMGLSEGLKLTLFPMIILSWTIERMSILWEEEGHKAVLTQGGGSLLVAILSYLVMSNEWVRHLTFNFLGLQFIFMALVLMCGSYTGYRLLELRRFGVFRSSET